MALAEDGKTAGMTIQAPALHLACIYKTQNFQTFTHFSPSPSHTHALLRPLYLPLKLFSLFTPANITSS